MKIIRELIYEYKSLDSFDIDTEGSIYCALFEELITIQDYCDRNDDIEEAIKQEFNDACYLCTVILNLYERPFLCISKLRDLISPCPPSSNYLSDANRQQIVIMNYEKIVLTIVYFLLNSIKDIEGNKVYTRTLAVLDGLLRDDEPKGCEYYENFWHACQNIDKQLSVQDFQCRVLTPDILKDLDWRMLTRDYDIKTIKELVHADFVLPEYKSLVIDAIENHVRHVQEDDYALPF